jgi:broad specificity phosphatase PhoE
VTSILLRHASAGDRDEWDGPDLLRPLDERGRRQAAELVELLRPYDPRRILSSPYVRCLETVEPLGAALGLPVEEDERLTEGAGPGARELLQEDGVLACTHGDIVFEVLGDGLKKGAAVVLQDGEVLGKVRAR